MYYLSGFIMVSFLQLALFCDSVLKGKSPHSEKFLLQRELTFVMHFSLTEQGGRLPAPTAKNSKK